MYCNIDTAKHKNDNSPFSDQSNTNTITLRLLCVFIVIGQLLQLYTLAMRLSPLRAVLRNGAVRPSVFPSVRLTGPHREAHTNFAFDGKGSRDTYKSSISKTVRFRDKVRIFPLAHVTISPFWGRKVTRAHRIFEWATHYHHRQEVCSRD